MDFRHEWKHEINYSDMIILRQRLKAVMKPDENAVDGKYCLILWSSTAGMALKWFKNNFAENFSFRELDELAEKIAPGSDGLTMLPYFTGSTMPKYNPDARASFSGLNLSHTRAHFARAIMEAIAFTLKQNLEYVGEDAIKEIRITGGGASSPLWSTIKSDVTGKVLKTLSESETACLGSALAAAVGIGDSGGLPTGFDRGAERAGTAGPGDGARHHRRRDRTAADLHFGRTAAASDLRLSAG